MIFFWSIKHSSKTQIDGGLTEIFLTKCNIAFELLTLAQEAQ